MIESGLKWKCTEVVTEELTADKIGSGLVKVFATPMMVALMERTCSESVAPQLGNDECTVGIPSRDKAHGSDSRRDDRHLRERAGRGRRQETALPCESLRRCRRDR